MKPLDPKLLRHASAARRYVLLTAGLGLGMVALTVLQARGLARLLGHAREAAGSSGTALLWLGGVWLLRAALAGLQEWAGKRSAHRVIAQLRAGLLARLASGPERERASAGVAQVELATRGLDALQPYLEGYVPQLLLTALATPALLVCVWRADPVSAALMAGSLPLIPLFMVLVGRFTREATMRQLASMQQLSARVLDLITGLATLRALGRHRGVAAQVLRLSEAHARTTLQALRRAFLSSFVLELITTLSIASVAVGIGLRLLDGAMALETGLFVLLLAPEVYAPLRQVGALFHASAEGAEAAAQAIARLEAPQPARGTLSAPPLTSGTLELRDVSVATRDAGCCAPDGLSFVLPLGQGRILGLRGESGAGKSTALAVMLGLLPPTRGGVFLRPEGGAALALGALDLTTYWPQLAWLPQQLHLEPGTVRESVCRGRVIPPSALAAAAEATGFDAVVARLPDGWDTKLGRDGQGLSLGQRQRLALTRVLVGDERLLLLDEPTAHLDEVSEQRVLEALKRRARKGTTLLLVSHRARTLAIADDVLTLHSHASSPDTLPEAA
ncbi:thiol reductant ABC exporter subunit CydD [Corallococcus macrosporus]|uniref:Thiol reductant ABC exporter subunit CydD n=1 Tax=Corallococcus macrosporus TaxID=35 RepID=A0ABS3DPX0_9BACT|nr:thiol reductant ABC exporter subunit CydD [Corallococcus macrosporus]MBN8233384.1 thiol reductant ABC exporter subunit CydD [Corallococcus macrosporus]